MLERTTGLDVVSYLKIYSVEKAPFFKKNGTDVFIL